MSDRQWNLALVSYVARASERLAAACDADPSLSVTLVESPERALDGLENGRFNLVAATYPPRGSWVDALRICAEHGLFVWVAAGEEVAPSLASTFDVEPERAIVAQGVLEIEDISPSTVRNACALAEYVKRLQDRVHASAIAAEKVAENLRLATFVIEHSDVVVFRWIPTDGSPISFVSENVQVFGYDASALVTARTSYDSFIHPDDLPGVRARAIGSLDTGRDRVALTYRILTADGDERWVEESSRFARDADGNVLFREGVVIDVTERRAAQDQLVRLSQAVEQSPASVAIADTEGRIEYVNQAFTDISGFEWDEVVGLQMLAFNCEDHGDGVRELWEAVRSGGEWRGELQKRRRDGTRYWEAVRCSPVRGAEGRITHYLELGEDITLRKQTEETIRQMAYHDALTGLANRTLFYDRLEQALATARRTGRILGVFFLDLDAFKAVNDTLGHAAGDELLSQVATRLRSTVRESDTVARMGGDEFMVLTSTIESATGGETLARKLIDAFSREFPLQAGSVRVTSSVGLALYPSDGDDAESLIKAADRAMYLAKQSGRDTFSFASSPN